MHFHGKYWSISFHMNGGGLMPTEPSLMRRCIFEASLLMDIQGDKMPCLFVCRPILVEESRWWPALEQHMLKTILIVVSCLLVGSAIAAEIPLDNPGFEKPKIGKRLPGWSYSQHAGVRAYEVTTDTESFTKGKSSIRMLRRTEQVYGLITQQVDSEDLSDKPVELTAALKSENVGEKGWVLVLTFKRFSSILDQVRATPVTGDTDWKDVVIRKVAPVGTNRIEVGFLLLDGGTGWADNVRLRTVESTKRSVEPEAGKSAKSQRETAPAEGATTTHAGSDAGPGRHE